MLPHTCPHDQTPLIAVKQFFYSLRLQAAETSRIGALINPGAQPQPMICSSCGYVGFYLRPDELSALVSSK